MLTTDTPDLGRTVRLGDNDWDEARTTFNLVIDQQPDLIVFPNDEREVATAVAFARERGLRVAAQGTGHNAGPLGSLAGTMLVNTSALTGLSIDADARRVRVGAGTKWGQVTSGLSELGLAALHGSSPDVGIVGYSLGGGLGWLGRKHGLQANAVTAVELVTADGKLMRVDADNEPDLFWALRGGGGNFGVVTAIEFSVLPVREVYAGAFFFPIAQAAEVLGTWTQLLPTLPEELTSWANVIHFPPLPEVPAEVRGQSFAIVMAAFLGSEAEGRELLEPLRRLGLVVDTFAMQPPAALGELAMDPPDPLPYWTGHALLDGLSPTAIDDIARIAGPGSALVVVQLRHMGGALARPAPDAGARAMVPGEICLFAIGVVPEPGAKPAVVTALDAMATAVAPHRVGEYASFVEQPADASAFFDPETWTRLRQVKARHDPNDLFRGNHHIPPLDTAQR